MAEEQKDQQSETAQTRPKAGRASSDEETFPVGRLLDDAPALLGHPSHVLAGALDHAGITKDNLTTDEAREAIDSFLAHEVA